MDNLIKIKKYQKINTSFNNNQIIIGRVIDIILDNKHEKFKELGEWDSLGTIFFAESNKNIYNESILENLPFAKPFHSYKKHYPLKGELVYIISFANIQSQNNLLTTDYYYLDVLNVWNHPHQNILPLINESDEKINNDYSKIGKGNLQKSKETSTSNSDSSTKFNNTKLKPLLPQEGDFILEGRFGSSIRFGSDINGNPITIIRNGQNPNVDEKGWIPNKEDINNDFSSIYFSTTGSIAIKVASSNLKSFDAFKNDSTAIVSPNFEAPNQYLTSSNLSPTSSFDLSDDFIVSEDVFNSSSFNDLGDILESTFVAPITGDINSINTTKIINKKDVKTSYPNLEFKQAKIIQYNPTQRAAEIKSAIPDFSKDIQKAVYIIMTYENSGKTYNYNGWGIEMKNGKWTDPEHSITHQIVLKEKASGTYKSYAGFDSIRSAIRFVAYALKRKNINASDPNLAEIYSKKWVGLSISSDEFNKIVNDANKLW